MEKRSTTVAEGGVKFDSDKNRLELIPPEAILAMGEILTYGAVKYEDRNWERGVHWSRPFGAAMRHLWAWWGGRGPTTKSFLMGSLDMETGRSHLWHAITCLAFLVAYEEREMKSWDDRPKPMDDRLKPAVLPDGWATRLGEVQEVGTAIADMHLQPGELVELCEDTENYPAGTVFRVDSVRWSSAAGRDAVFLLALDAPKGKEPGAWWSKRFHRVVNADRWTREELMKMQEQARVDAVKATSINRLRP